MNRKNDEGNEGGNHDSTYIDTHKLIHISNVVSRYETKNNKEINKRDNHSNKSYDDIPILDQIDIRDFDNYINYITKINIIKNLYEEDSKDIDIKQFDELLKDKIDNTNTTEKCTKKNKEFNMNFEKMEHYSKPDYNIFFDENVSYDISTLTSFQEHLSEDLDTIEKNLSILISNKLHEYFYIILILQNMNREIENLHNELFKMKTTLKDFKEIILKMIHMNQYSELKRRYCKIRNIFKHILYFQKLQDELKCFLQRKLYYYCLSIINKIVATYQFNQTITLKYDFFKVYSSNFQWNYLRRVIAQKMQCAFSFYSVLFIFKKYKQRNVYNTKKSIHEKEEKDKDDVPLNLSDSEKYKSNISSNYSDEEKSCGFFFHNYKVCKSVKFYRLMNTQFLCNYRKKTHARKQRMEITLNKCKSLNTYVYKWKRKKNVHKLEKEIVKLNDLFIPLLLSDAFFNLIDYLCSNKKYIDTFMRDLFFETLKETVFVMQNESDCDVNNVPMMSMMLIETTVKEEEAENMTEYFSYLNKKIDMNNKYKTIKKRNKNINKEFEMKTANGLHESKVHLNLMMNVHTIDILQTCIDKNILKYTKSSFTNNLYKYIGFFPLSYFTIFLKNFFTHTKRIYYNIKRWMFFILYKSFSILFHYDSLDRMKNNLNPLFFENPLLKKIHILHKMGFLFFKCLQNYIHLLHIFLESFLSRTVNSLHERQKANIHLSLQQITHFFWNFMSILFFIRNKNANSAYSFFDLFFYIYFKYFQNRKRDHITFRDTSRLLQAHYSQINRKHKIQNKNHNKHQKGDAWKELIKAKDKIIIKAKLFHGIFKVIRTEPEWTETKQERRRPLKNYQFQSIINKRKKKRKPQKKRKNNSMTRTTKYKYNRIMNRKKLNKWKEAIKTKIYQIKITINDAPIEYIYKYFYQEAKRAIKNHYDFKKVQIEKLFENEKWNIMEFPSEINDTLKKYFNIENTSINKIKIQENDFYMTNTTVTFLSIVSHSINLLITLPFITAEIIENTLLGYENVLQHVYDFLINAQVVAKNILTSITIKTLAVAVNTVNFLFCLLKYFYSIASMIILEISKGRKRKHKKNRKKNSKFSIKLQQQKNEKAITNRIEGKTRLARENKSIQSHKFKQEDNKMKKKKENSKDTSSTCADSSLTTTQNHINKHERHFKLNNYEKKQMIRTETVTQNAHTELEISIDRKYIKHMIRYFRNPFENKSFYHEHLPINVPFHQMRKEKQSDKFKFIVEKVIMVKKKLLEKIIDILTLRFDYYTNLWLASENLLHIKKGNSNKYECDILPFGIQLSSTYKVLSKFLNEEDRKHLFSLLFQDIANRFKLRINVLVENQKYKNIVQKLTENESLPKSDIDNLILNYYHCEFNEKIKKHINKNVGDKILIDITNVLVVLYKIPCLHQILENFLKDFQQICKTFWVIHINPFGILKKYKK